MDVESQIRELVAPFDVECSPGGVIAVARQGIVETVVPFGYANLEHAVPNARETTFYIASTSKQFVAAAIAILEADGLLNAEDSLALWVPELEHLGDIRVQHLVHHTSGIRDKYGLAALGDLPEVSVGTDAGTMALLKRQRSLNFEPGSRFMYSNSGYFLLAMIVERCSGRSFIDFTNERLFVPMGMSGTRFRCDTSEVIAGRATGYAPRPGGGWSTAEYTWSSLGPGGVVSTVDSLARWGMVYQGSPLRPEDLSTRLLHTVPLADGTQGAYAYGVLVGEYGGQPMVLHAGGVHGFAAEMIQLPSQGLTVICLANSPAVGAPMLAQKVLELCVPAPPSSITTSVRPAPAVAQLLGRYVHDDETGVATVTLDGESVRLSILGAEVALSLTDGGWAAANGWVVEADAKGLRLRVGAQEVSYRRVAKAAPPENACIVGTFHSAELNTTLTITEYEGHAMIAWPDAAALKLSAFAGDLMTVHIPKYGATVAVRLVHDGGAVSALRISVDRALGSIFERV